MAGRFSVEAAFGARDNFSRVVGRIESRATAAMRRLEGVAGKAARGFGAGAAKLSEQLASGVASLGKGAAVAGLAALSAGITRAVTVGGNLEQALSSVAAVTGASGKDIDFLKSRVIDLSSKSTFSALQISQAFETLAKSGYSFEGALKALPGALNTAAADGGDLQEVVTGLVGSMAGLGLGADKMQLLGDTLAKASDLGSASISSLNEALVKAAPVMRQLNIPLADSVAMVSLLQNAGMDASSSGTQLAAVFSKLSAPIGSTAKALTSLGVDVKDSFGNLKAPKDLFGDLLKSIGKIQGNAGKMEALVGLFGLESKVGGMTIATAAANGQLDDMVAKLQQVDGYAQSIADQKTDNLWGDLTKLLNVVDGLGASLFGIQGSGIRSAVQWFTKLVDSNKALITTNVRGFLEQAKPVIAAFADGFKSAWPAIEGALKSLTSLGADTNWLKTAQEFAVTLGKVTAFTIGAAGVIGTVLVGSLRLAAAQFDLVVGAAEGAWGWLIAAIGRVVFTIEDMVHFAGAKWERLKTDAIAGAKSLVDGLVSGLTNGAQWVIDAAKNLGKSAIDAIKTVLRIKSPSQVFAGIGGQTAQGFELGFERSMAAVSKTMTSSIIPPTVAPIDIATRLAQPSNVPRWAGSDVQTTIPRVLRSVRGATAFERANTLAVAQMAVPRTPLSVTGATQAAAASREIERLTVAPARAVPGRALALPAAAPLASIASPQIAMPAGRGDGRGGEDAIIQKLEEIRRSIERKELSVNVTSDGTASSSGTSGTSGVRSMPRVTKTGGM
jgi:TP901 family phage tail tape measure protein